MTVELSPECADVLMSAALLEARHAYDRNEVPVGAVMAHRGAIIARGFNTTEHDSNVCSHAELNVIRSASLFLDNWRLDECIMCVTLEPCTMCLGAIRLARIPILIFGAGDSKQGAVGSLYDLSLDPRLGKELRVIRGVRGLECSEILSSFFRERRGGD